MRSSPWNRLAECADSAPGEAWLTSVLSANARTAYLVRYGSPPTLAAFRDSVPLVSYEDIGEWIARIANGEADVLFGGRPVAYERTGGSSGGSKLIAYSQAGLADFRRALVPWLTHAVKKHRISGKAYFSISPATRAPESIGGVPVGLDDGAYLGRAVAEVLGEVTAVPWNVARIPDVEQWRAETLRYLSAARDLELISVWSPTFLLELLRDIDDPGALWPQLKLVSCWAAAGSRPFAQALSARLPHAYLQPKGLLSTEAAVTVPDADDRPALSTHGFFEFSRGEHVFLADELDSGEVYEVVVTTASGLYRYRTGDRVRYEGRSVASDEIVSCRVASASSSITPALLRHEEIARKCVAVTTTARHFAYRFWRSKRSEEVQRML